MSNSSTEELTKIGSVFGAYFLVQAYGYAVGFEGDSLRNAPDFTVNKAIVFGFQHISYILRPWDKLAWPLTPVLGLPLLLYSLYLPQVLNRAGDGNEVKSICVYLSFLFNVALFPLISGILGASLAASLVYGSVIDPKGIPGMLSVIYIFSWVFGFFVTYKFLFRPLRVTKWIQKINDPWPDIMTGCSIGIILFAVYLGSEFDGAKDRLIAKNTHEAVVSTPGNTLFP